MKKSHLDYDSISETWFVLDENDDLLDICETVDDTCFEDGKEVRYETDGIEVTNVEFTE